MLQVTVRNLLCSDNLGERPQRRPDKIVFFLSAIQAMPQPDTPRDIEVCSCPGHEMPTFTSR